MPTAEITDGTTTIAFELFTGFDASLAQQNTIIRAYPGGRGQRVRVIGSVAKLYKFQFVFKGNGTTAYAQYELFESLCETQHRTYGYQRKITFERPGGGGTKEVNGVVTIAAAPVKYGDDEQKVVGEFDFIIDTLSKQVP